MAVYKILKGLKESLENVEKQQPVNWFGKWAKSIKLNSIRRRIYIIENSLKQKNKN